MWPEAPVAGNMGGGSVIPRSIGPRRPKKPHKLNMGLKTSGKLRTSQTGVAEALPGAGSRRAGWNVTRAARGPGRSAQPPLGRDNSSM